MIWLFILMVGIVVFWFAIVVYAGYKMGGLTEDEYNRYLGSLTPPEMAASRPTKIFCGMVFFKVN